MHAPTTPAAFSALPHTRPASARTTRTRRAIGTRRSPSPPSRSRSILVIALVGGVVAFVTSTLGGYVTYLSERSTNEYAGLVIYAALLIGLVAIFPGALLAGIGAWSLEWHSRRAMWTAGLLAGAGGPALLWLFILLQ